MEKVEKSTPKIKPKVASSNIAKPIGIKLPDIADVVARNDRVEPKVENKPVEERENSIDLSPIEIERGLISKYIESGDVTTIEDYQIRGSFFTGEHKRVFKYIQDFYRDYGEIPSERVLKSSFPYYELDSYVNSEGVRLVGNKEPLTFWCTKVRHKNKHNTIAAEIEKVAGTLDNMATDEAYAQLKKLIVTVENDIEISRTLNITEDVDKRIERYKFRKENQGMIGIPTGLDRLDYVLKGFQDKQLITMIAGTGVGKSNPLSTPVLTPEGYVPMRDIKVGSTVIGEDGKPYPVLAIFPQGELDVYKLRFNDNTTSRCSLDHLWKYKTEDDLAEDKEWRVDTLESIIELKESKGEEYKIYIPVNEPVEFQTRNLLVDPYIFGKEISDTSLSNEKVEINIPSIYLHSSIEQRRELMKGLFERIRQVSSEGSLTYYSCSKNLIEDVKYLVRSLGYRCIEKVSDREDRKYRLDIKEENLMLIEKVEKIGREECQCISVGSEDKTYIVDDFIVTHNTWAQVILGANAMLENYKVLQIVTEMSEEQMQDRYDAYLYGKLVGSLNYERFKSGKLLPEEEHKFIEFLETRVPKLSDLWIDSANNVSSIRALIQKYEPDIVFVDGVYLMKDERGAKDDWLRIAHITRDLKKLAKDEELPIMINSQADQNTSEKTGPGLNNFSYSSAIGQDSDVVLALFRDKEMIEDHEMQLKVLKQREGTLSNIMLTWDFKTMKFETIFAEEEHKETIAKEDKDTINIKEKIGI